MAPQPFTIAIPQADLDDLHARLAHTRWPNAIAGMGWTQGTDLDYLRDLVEYWRTGFDWRAQERALNALPQYTATIDGTSIHFVHVRGKGPQPLPLILTHGWPNTFADMCRLIPLLTDPASHGGDPADAFDVVIPSVPGYGFSERLDRAITPTEIAGLWGKLMIDVLGYERFGAHGYDIGARITNRVGRLYPQQVVGFHVTSIGGPDLVPDDPSLSERERAFLREIAQWEADEGGYSHLQETRPQTPAFALNDSPTGLAAWIVEKYRAWSDCGGVIERAISRDAMLTTISIYWFTQTIASSFRHYYDSIRDPWPLPTGERNPVPCGAAIFQHDLDHPPREWAERSYDIRHWSEFAHGGHFPALEVPEVLAEDIRALFRLVR